MTYAFPKVVVEAGFTVTDPPGTLLHLDDAVLGLLDTGTLAGDENWEDLSDAGWTREVTITRGSNRVESPLIKYEAGTATIELDNRDRRFDPTHLGGPYVAAGRTQLMPMRPIRIRATWAGVTYDLYRGYADDWQPSWDHPTMSVTTVPCFDAFEALANNSRAAVAAVGAGETTGQRIHRILDSAGWSPIHRLISMGDSTVQATTLEGEALAELQRVADSELGELYVDGAGRVVFRNRRALLTDSRSNTSQATFGDDRAAGELPYQDPQAGNDKTQLYNLVRIGRAGGTVQVTEDTSSREEFFTRTFERDDLLLETDAEARDYAAWILHISREPELRFAQITINPMRNPTELFPQVLGREIGDRITVIRRPPGGGDPVVRDCFIRGIVHEIKQARWRTTWTLQSATKVSSFVTLDHPSLGQLDANALAY
ncbi:hypothetical protein FHS43_006162 [Streptosporangium becharense]|uniref:Uncharacterized protein n=1 Tax=Streptosporangium becharense TaxID=1816182 RepID=A0A7W9IGI4_9ACTN|nr:hypothetical protein [Streptosporangium becharense]MBB2914850.1 hypothetical protein [Streptosporangium becharense]MBB5820339.1 hypothetical protein [Streptosporangium becharense]